MAKQFDYTLGNDKQAVAKSTVAALGGGVAVRLIVDDGVLLTKEQAHLGLRIVLQRVMEERWPIA